MSAKENGPAQATIAWQMTTGWHFLGSTPFNLVAEELFPRVHTSTSAVWQAKGALYDHVYMGITTFVH